MNLDERKGNLNGEWKQHTVSRLAHLPQQTSANATWDSGVKVPIRENTHLATRSKCKAHANMKQNLIAFRGWEKAQRGQAGLVHQRRTEAKQRCKLPAVLWPNQWAWSSQTPHLQPPLEGQTAVWWPLQPQPGVQMQPRTAAQRRRRRCSLVPTASQRRPQYPARRPWKLQLRCPLPPLEPGPAVGDWYQTVVLSLYWYRWTPRLWLQQEVPKTMQARRQLSESCQGAWSVDCAPVLSWLRQRRQW